MSTDHTSGMSPLDALSLDTGAFVSESAVSSATPASASQESIPDQNPGSLANTTGGFGFEPRSTAMEFRVIRSGSPVRRLRLTGNRYTFGSAEGCSIQLNDSSLRPMHAVLIRDAHRILVRAYSVPIELNDCRTTEASVNIGDVIRMGSYSFELLSSASPTFDLPSYEPPQSFIAPAHEDPTAWREQLRREIAQWRARQAECDRREGRCSDRESVLRSRESELWSRAEQLHRRESHLMAQESAAIQIQEDYAAKQQELVQLRDENRTKQHAYEARESEFRSLEQEYREHVEEASRQLQQSQQQAEAATQAVQRMREQFADLNKQLEELQRQQSDLQQRESHQTSEHQRLRLELEAARDSAVDGQAEEIVRRQEIEQQIGELDEQLLEANAACEAERKRADESEEVAQALREQIAQLHENIGLADGEASQLRQDYEQACESIRTLEAIIEQGNTRGEMDRESWYGEAEELRQSVEQLSIDLARANTEIGDLRKANEELSDRLNGLTRERDEALEEVDSRPTQDAFESLREELNQANEKLAEMQREYEETLERLESARSESDSQEDNDSDDSSASAALLGIAGAAAATSISWAETAEDQLVDHEDANDEVVSEDLHEEVLSEASGCATDEETLSEVVDDPQSAWPSYDRIEHDGEEVVEAFSDDTSDETEHGPTLKRSESPFQGFRSPSIDDDGVSDDTPQWSGEPMQKTDAPHFETSEVENFSSIDTELNDQPENYTAEFDRASEDRASEDRASVNDETDQDYASANESVDHAIDLIEKNVDDAMSIDLAEQTDRSSETINEEDPLPTGWGNEVLSDDSEMSDSQSEADVTSPWGMTEDVSDDSDPYEDQADEAVSLWKTDSEGQSEVDEPQSNADVTSPWNSAQAFEEEAVDQEMTTEEDIVAEDENALVSSWQPITDQEDGPEHDEDDHQSMGLANQLISDLGSSDPEPVDDVVEGEATSDQTYQWDQTQPFSEAQAESSGLGWDREFAEESRSSEWDNDVDGNHTEVIRDGLIESVMETPSDESTGFAESTDDVASGLFTDSADDDNESSSYNDSMSYQDSESPEDQETQETSSAYDSDPVDESHQAEEEEDDDSIEAYMNRLLNRVQGSPGTEETPAKSVPLVASTDAMDDQATQSPTETSFEEQPVSSVDLDAPLVPRSQAPERNSDLSAMRELANQSARTAVAHSVRIQARDTQLKAMMKFAQAGIAAFCGLACFTFLDWSMTLKMIIIVAILIITGILVQEGLVLLKEAKRRLQSPETPGPDADETSTS